MAPDQDKFSFQHISLAVTDVDRSAAFYMKIFGFEEIPNLTRKPWIRWLGFDKRLELHLIQSETHEIKITRQVHLAWSTGNFEVFLQELAQAYPENSNWLNAMVRSVRADGAKQVYFQDPDGYWIEVNDAH